MRNNAEGDRPVRRILPDRSIPIIHQLIAVVLELLAKVVEHRPGFVAGGAAQTIFARESGKGVRVADGKGEKRDARNTLLARRFRAEVIESSWCNAKLEPLGPVTTSQKLLPLLPTFESGSRPAIRLFFPQQC